MDNLENLGYRALDQGVGARGVGSVCRGWAHAVRALNVGEDVAHLDNRALNEGIHLRGIGGGYCRTGAGSGCAGCSC
jgi:hypothetical protein